MKRRFSLFTYPMMDMKAAKAELNRRAAAGWQMEKVWMGVLAVFVPAHVPVCYCIDWSDPGRDDGPDYRALLERFEKDGLIRRTRTEDNRKYYILMPEGERTLQNEYERIKKQAADMERVLQKEEES